MESLYPYVKVGEVFRFIENDFAMPIEATIGRRPRLTSIHWKKESAGKVVSVNTKPAYAKDIDANQQWPVEIVQPLAAQWRVMKMKNHGASQSLEWFPEPALDNAHALGILLPNGRTLSISILDDGDIRLCATLGKITVIPRHTGEIHLEIEPDEIMQQGGRRGQ